MSFYPPAISDHASDVMSYFRDMFQEDLTRSRATKLKIAELIPNAIENIYEILTEGMSDKNRATKAQVAQWVLDRNMINTELPRLQMSLIKTEKESRSMETRTIRYEPVRMTQEKMEELLKDALEVDNEIRLLKAKQQLQLNDGKKKDG